MRFFTEYNRSYVYVLCDPRKRLINKPTFIAKLKDGDKHFNMKWLPFYVGKGVGNRCFDHFKLATKGETGEKYDIIREIYAQIKREPFIYIVETHMTDREASIVEAELIRMIGEGLSNVIQPSARRIEDESYRKIRKDGKTTSVKSRKTAKRVKKIDYIR